MPSLATAREATPSDPSVMLNYTLFIFHTPQASPVLAIEFSDPDISLPCECCGGRSVALTRFVTEDGNAYAIYYIRYSMAHPERPALATVSIGEWSEDASPNQRNAFALELRTNGVRVMDSKESPWKDAVLIGRTLDREEALVHPRIKDVFHIADHIYLEDEEVKRHLQQMNAEPSH